MKKNIYEMLNDSNIEVDESNKEGFNDIELGKVRKNFKKSVQNNKFTTKKKIAVAAAVLLTVTALTTNAGDAVMAGIKIVGADIASFMGRDNLEEYTTIVGTSETKNGVSIQLNEAILDGDKLIVSTTIKTHDIKLKSDSSILEFPTIFINGKISNGGSAGGARVIDENTYESVIEYGLENIYLDGELDIKISYSNVTINGEEKKGPWIFEFRTNGGELKADTYTKELNNTFEVATGKTMTLEKYTANKVSNKIYATTEWGKDGYDVELKGTDDLGNEIYLYLRESNGDKKTALFESQYPIDENAKELKVKVYAAKFPEKSGKMNDTVKIGDEIVIKIK